MRNRSSFILFLFALAVPAVMVTVLSLSAQFARPAQAASLAPELLLNKTTVAASNTPTQTTLISVTNPLTSAAGVGVTIYKTTEAAGLQACPQIVSTMDPGASLIITLTETSCGAVDFFGEAVINSDKTLLAGSTVLRITTHYVALGGNCGLSAGRCYASPQAAADIASDGDSIKVAQGTYTSEAFNVLFLNRAVTVTGGYTTSNWSVAYPMTQPVALDGRDNAGQRVVQVNGSGAGVLTLDGLNIQRGNFETGNGAGLNIVSGTVVVRNSSILSNTGQGGAGVSYLSGGTIPAVSLINLTLESVTLSANTIVSGGRGSALTAQGVNVVISNSLIVANRAADVAALDMRDGSLDLRQSTVRDTVGMGISAGPGILVANNNAIANNRGTGLLMNSADAIVISNTIESNSAPDREGGGVAISTICIGTINLQNNIIRKNTARMGGGVGGRAFGLSLTGNLIEDNLASESGGGMHFAKDTVITSCVVPAINMNANRVLRNSAPQAGAIVIDTGVAVRGTNDLVANNVTTGFQTASVQVLNGQLETRYWTLVNNGRYGFSTGNTASASITNALIAGHIVAGASGNVTVDHALFFENGSTCSSGATCSNALSGDPKFRWAQLGDYHICQGSAALDVAVNAGVTTDFEDQVRPQGAGYDIGADEWDLVNCRPVRMVWVPIVVR